MSDIKLTTAGDIDLTTGDLILLEGPDAIGQHLRIRFSFFLGEWYLDTRIGIPYFQTILKKGARLNVVRAIFQKVILDTPGVEGLRYLDLDYEGTTRALTVTFDADIVGADQPVHFEEELII